MAIMITNDDGDSIGLRLLLEAAKQFDKEIYALVPHKQRSAISKSLTLHKVLRLNKKEDGIYEFSGTPADAVLFALYAKELPKPDLVLSGINFGDNSSLDAILSSGTVGACWQAMLYGVPSIAFSIYRTPENWNDKKNWGNLELLKKSVITVIKLLKEKLDSNSFYSVNFPNDLTDTKIVFPKKLQRTRFNVNIEKRLDPGKHPYYWLCGDFSKLVKGTDSYEVGMNKNIVISRISIKDFSVSD